MLQKKLFVAVALAGFALIGFSTAANAALPGFYAGGQLGYGHTSWTNSDLHVNSASIDQDGLAGRVFGGFEFNENWAAELGYTRFPNTDVKNINGVAGNNGDINNQYDIDLVAKGILPLANSFSMYGKLGGAYAKASSSRDLITSSSRVYPTFGVGLSYDITPNVPVDLSWNRVQKVNNGPIPSTDLFAVGVAYNFG